MDKAIVEKLLNYLLEILKQENYTLIYIIILIIISVLLYKQFKQGFEESNKIETTQFWQYAKQYSLAMLNIDKYKTNDINYNDLRTKLYEFLPYATKDLEIKIFEMSSSKINDADIDEIIEDINKLLKKYMNGIKTKKFYIN